MSAASSPRPPPQREIGQLNIPEGASDDDVTLSAVDLPTQVRAPAQSATVVCTEDPASGQHPGDRDLIRGIHRHDRVSLDVVHPRPPDGGPGPDLAEHAEHEAHRTQSMAHRDGQQRGPVRDVYCVAIGGRRDLRPPTPAGADDRAREDLTNVAVGYKVTQEAHRRRGPSLQPDRGPHALLGRCLSQLFGFSQPITQRPLT